ncbi:serine/threonine protein kinase [Nostoc sp. CENA543]|uniref:AAA family ATPase n=1 Tax=Nostoc sp. CENA543 TaxID=1869241 RepID=UPI000CA23E18|nr:AAA family ATPase [Nostoc sp. CENA543]AUT01592.1 serine/threonine protein kinase [Nostoc sp. CENA543]
MTPQAAKFPEISGYTITEQIYRGSRTAVYRAIRESQKLPVVIKVLQQEYPTFGELVQFRNQYAIAKNLPITGIIPPLSLEPYGNSYALIMADWGGISLETYIQQQSLDLTDTLAIAIQLAEILHQLHQHRVIHKDIKPANILIHPQSKQIKLIDLSIATLLPKETPQIQNPSTLEGTLAYLAPEQTGRMNRGIDYRSDFYALGITLYQLLTSRLPFLADDPLELVHCHIAKIATFVHEINTDIPPILGAIVAKLMAKNAEDRYQSALGLQHDLEVCYSQWQQTQSIAPFDLGQRDLCDRFLIPEQLYGRETEVQLLLDAFARVAQGTSEMMLVAGFSGIGKTAVVNEVQKPIVKQRGYFIKGKFDQFNRNIPFSAFVQGFRDLVGQLLSESDTQLQHWKHQILAALGENAQVIVELIPELERIIGRQPPAPELSGTAAQNRFNLLFHRFMQVFTAPAHPLVMFVDDLQWADSASLNLIQVLMSESQTGCLLLLGAYRDNEVFAAHPLMLTLSGMEKAGAKIHTMTLQPLSFSSLNHLIADTLHAPTSVVQPLTQLVMQKTQGNPFFATQFLQALHQDQLIHFDANAGYWQCDIVQVQDAALTDDVVELMAQQLQKLPAATQEILKLAACMGAQFDLTTLAIVSRQSPAEVATQLWQALQAGLILPHSDLYKFYLSPTPATPHTLQENCNYRFLHDRVQQAAYSLIPQALKQITHLKIGQLLLQKSANNEREERLFEIVNHLNIGRALISQPQEREDLAQLNLEAGRKAKTSTAYEAAIAYLSTGIELLPKTAWESHYSLSLALHEEMAEASYLNTDFEQMEKWADLVLQQAQNLLDTIKVQQTRIMAAKAQGKLLDSLNIGLQVLQQLGIEFPQQPTQEDIQKAYEKARSHWIDKPPQSLLDLPIMSDPHLLAAMNILTILTPAAYVTSPNLMLLLIFKQVELSIKSGNAPVSIFTYGDYGIVLCGIMGDITNGYNFGELALSLLERFQAKSFRGRSGYVVNTYIKHWKVGLSEIVPCLQAAYHHSLESGDIEALGCNAVTYCTYAYHQGQNLTEIVKTMEAYRQTIIQYKLAFSLPFQEIYQQTTLNLLGETATPYILTGTIFNQEQSLPQLQATNQRTALFYWFFNQSILYYIFAKNSEAIQTSAEAAKYLDGVVGMFIVPLYFWFDALIQLAQSTKFTPVEERQSILLKVKQHQEKLHYWATLSPVNHQHRWQLIEAERYRVIGNRADAVEAYDRAIAGAKANGFIQDEALANELAAKFYLNWEKEKVAAGYMQEAYYCYARWGAKAKVINLETSYPHLLSSILQQTQASTSILSTLATISPTSISNHSSTLKSSSSTKINYSLDFAAILKASQALSSTIQFDELLHQLTQIILQNSGADRCALMLLSETGEWQVQAIATPNETQLCAEPLTNHPHVPIKLIQYVKNTQEFVVIDNMETTLPVIGDYLRRQQPKSILCFPLLHQGHLIGILYLNNQLTCGVFTAERILILNFLCTQAAISLENARLYQQLEHSLQDARQKSQDLAEVLALSNGQQQILALIAQGVSLNTILAATARSIESQARHPAYCSFLLIDAEGRLRYGAAPSLPAAYNVLVDGIKIGPEVGSCGTAAYCKASVTVTDIATDPLWANYRVALDFGLRACASTPILGAEGQVLATLAMYQPVAGEFTLHDRKLMEVATYLARIAIERHQADIELQNTQLQVLQSEKMASLGNLVAGVAHEINNPIGFLNGSITNGQDYVKDLLGHLTLYQQHYPQPVQAIQDNAEAIDLEFLSEDLLKLLKSMKGATNRITNISNSLRSFSRADTEYKVFANLHEGLDSTLLILKYRLKANEHRPAIQVIQEFGDLPPIECFPGQLNQVFMNILANAIDMFDEMAQTQSFPKLEANPQIITISTEVISNQVYIRIRDNGKGMTQEVQGKIFDHLFTTKAVGKGTGLGLAIARQIVVEKHGGSLSVHSELGKGSEFTIQIPV